jgi:hypothetical protein
VFLDPDFILLPTERIVNEALKHYVDIQTTKKGEQLLENLKNSTAL